MNFATQGNAVYASFELVLRLEDGRGVTVFERTEEIPLRISPDQYRAHERQRFAFQDLLAVVPGDYRALFLLKNKTAKDFSSFETRLSVPPAEAAAALSAPLLYYSRSAVPEAQRQNLKAFAFGGQQYLAGARNEFPDVLDAGRFRPGPERGRVRPGRDAVRDDRAGLRPRPLLARHERERRDLSADGRRRRPRRSGDPPRLRRRAARRTSSPATTAAGSRSLASDGRPLLTTEDDFVVLGQPYPVIPWVYARLHGPFPGPEHLLVLGSQHFLKGEYGPARDIFERGPPGARRPRRPSAARQVALRPGALQGVPGPRHGRLRARRRPGGGQGHGPRPGRTEGLDLRPGHCSRSSWPRRPRSPF